MRLATGKIPLLHDLIANLYSAPFEEALILDTAQRACSILESQYSAFFLFPNDDRSGPIFISNNPPEFVPVYLSVISEDFLIGSTVQTASECVLRRLPDFDQPAHNEFIQAVQKVRPISDVIYIPVMAGGRLNGYCAMARAEFTSPIYTDDELDVFRFIVSFVSDAFKRSALPPPLEDDVAYLDHRGHILSSGAHIRDAFEDLFGDACLLETAGFRAQRRKVFTHSYKRFLHSSFSVGMDRVTLRAGGRRYVFSFSLFTRLGLSIREDGIPYASVRLIECVQESPPNRPNLEPQDLPTPFAFTAREREVIDGIYKGWSNKRIAYELGIEESTVKRFTHNIYEKTGFATRVELVMGLAGRY